MISYIQGEVIFSDADSICIFANGVGWTVNVPDSLIYTIGESYSVFCYTHQTQDQISLWGVKTIEELKFFKKLVGISGVGPRTASTLISSKGLDAIVSSVEAGDVAALKVKGLGEKTLQKIIIELKGNLDLSKQVNLPLSSKANDILEALTNLGYSKNDVTNFLAGKDLTTIDEKSIIKEFLKNR